MVTRAVLVLMGEQMHDILATTLTLSLPPLPCRYVRTWSEYAHVRTTSVPFHGMFLRIGDFSRRYYVML